MTAPELRQEIIDALRSVVWIDNPDNRNHAIKVEADTVMEAVERYLAAMNAREGRQGGE